jgi:hypothetical protein
MLSTFKQDGHGGHGSHEDLRGSGHRKVIPYVNGRMRVVVLLCVLFNSEVELA